MYSTYIFFKYLQKIFTFIQSRFLLVAHHLLLPFFIFPVFMGGLKSFNGGDCLVAAGFLLEASTPFVSLRKILAILGLCTMSDSIFGYRSKFFKIFRVLLLILKYFQVLKSQYGTLSMVLL